MKVVIESALVRFSEGKISGTAAIPRFSLNGNGYTPEVLEANDGACVPIDWNHDQREGAGSVCFRYDRTNQELRYDGNVEDKEILEEIRKLQSEGKQMHVSIEGNVSQVDRHCNSKTCYHIPVEMQIVRMAITPTPGIPQTTLTLAETFTIKEEEDCKPCHEKRIKALEEMIEKLTCPDCGKLK